MTYDEAKRLCNNDLDDTIIKLSMFIKDKSIAFVKRR